MYRIDSRHFRALRCLLRNSESQDVYRQKEALRLPCLTIANDDSDYEIVLSERFMNAWILAGKCKAPSKSKRFRIKPKGSNVD